MPDNNSYQTDIAKLDKYHRLASDNSDKPGFFNYLFKYFQVLSADTRLNQAAFRFWFDNAIEKNKDNEDVLLEIIAPVFGTSSKAETKEKLQEFSDKQFKPSYIQMLRFFMSINDRLDKLRYKEVDPSYCFYKLYFNFYSTRNLDPKKFQTGIDLFYSNPDKATEILRQELSEKELLDIRESLNNPDTKKALRSISKIMEDYSIVPTKELLAGFTQEDYVVSLNIFHTEFIDWLKDNEDKFNNESGQEPQTEVELIFDEDSINPKVKIADIEYTFTYIKPKAYEVIKYCYKNPGISVGTERFPDINFRGKGILNVLRGSKFYPPKGSLSVFLTLSGRPKKITLHRKRKVNDSQLQQIVNEAND